jgi:DNA-binding transcriptional LysR family regulator
MIHETNSSPGCPEGTDHQLFPDKSHRYKLKKSFSLIELLVTGSGITLEALQLVEAIARRGSFAAAAAELDRVPSAVTYAVRRLEDELDVLLFDRRGYRARLTPAGEELLREGRHLLTAAEDLVRRVRRVAKGWETELRIALDSIIPFERLLPLIAQFSAAAPTQVRVAHEVLGGTWDALVTGRADLAIGAPGQGPSMQRLGTTIRTEKLAEVEFVFAIAPTHPLASLPEPLPLAQLRRHRQVVVGDTSQRLAPRTSGLLDAPDTLTVPSMQAKFEAQIAGLGVGYLPAHLARSAIENGRLIVKSVEGGPGTAAPTGLHFAWRTDARGKALNWWLAELRRPGPRAALTR